MAYNAVLYEKDGGVLTITMNRPDKLNAADDHMLAEMNDAFKQAEADAEVRAILLTGAGRGFCAGADLAAGMEHLQTAGGMSYGKHLRETFNPLILRMRRIPKPVVGAVNGAAAGAGMSIAMACDVRIAAESASYLQAFVKIGLLPDSGSTWLLPRLVGNTRALDLMMTGRKIGSKEALEWGLVNQVVPDDQLMPTARQIAAEFASGPTQAYGFIKRAYEFALGSTLEEALEREADLQDVAGRTADHREGVAAFLEKRPAKFKGE